MDADGQPRERALAPLTLPEAYAGEPIDAIEGEVVADDATSADGGASAGLSSAAAEAA